MGTANVRHVAIAALSLSLFSAGCNPHWNYRSPLTVTPTSSEGPLTVVPAYYYNAGGDFSAHANFAAAKYMDTHRSCVYLGPWYYYYTLSQQDKRQPLSLSSIATEVREAWGQLPADTIVVDEGSLTYVLLGCSADAAARAKQYNDNMNAKVDKIRVTTRESVIHACTFISNASFEDTKEWDIKYSVMKKGGNVLFIGSESNVVTGGTTEHHRTIYGGSWSDTTTSTTHTVSGEVYKCP